MPSAVGGGKRISMNKSPIMGRTRNMSRFGTAHNNRKYTKSMREIITKRDKQIQKDKIEHHQLSKLEKLDQKLIYLYQITIEMSLVDLVFSTTFNIEGDYSQGFASFYFGKFTSLVTLTMVFIHYYHLLLVGLSNTKMSKFERELMEEGLNLKALSKFKSVRVLNTVFKLKIIFMMMVIVVV